MLTFRFGVVGARVVGMLHAQLVENGPKICSVKLLHTVQQASHHVWLNQQVVHLKQHPAWRDFKAREMGTVGRGHQPIPPYVDPLARVMAVCKAFDKIAADKLTTESHFIKDLGLDSLDHVEVIMAVEDEFGFEIPDEHAEKLITPTHIANYVKEHEEGL